MSEATSRSDIGLPFPIEFLIRDTPRSHQSSNAPAKERWKRNVGAIAEAHVNSLTELFFLDDRPLSVTIFYFPPAAMAGDIDNIAKLILDGMVNVIYPDDRLLERVLVQKFEPEVVAVFRSMTPVLAQATEAEPLVIYIRIDDDLGWRNLP